MDLLFSKINSIPGMAKEIGRLSPQYRSRKLELYIVLQALSQLSPELREQVWSIGNIVSFAVSNFEETYELAQQIFTYRPDTVKLQAKTDTTQPMIETDRGQYLQIANQMQRMKHRECLMRRYESEKILDRYIRWVRQTKDIPTQSTDMTVLELKEKLLKERGVRVRDALQVINQRRIGTVQSSPPQL